MVSALRAADLCRFEIRPNRSLSWRGVQCLYLCVASVCLSIGAGFAAIGFWPVLPFAGAELLALAGAFYVCARDGQRTEVIWVQAETVEVEKGGRRIEFRHEFVRAWTRVALVAPRVARHPSRLLLRAPGREVEIGGFLTEDERRRLAGELEAVIHTGIYTGRPIRACGG